MTTNKAQLIQLREKVKQCAQQGLNNSQIAEKLKVSRVFVIKWRKTEDVHEDKRGWQSGKKRKYTDKQEQLVVQIRQKLEQGFFLALGRSCRSFLGLKIFLRTSLSAL